MKKIKIKILNYDQNDRCSYGFFIVNILKKYYEVEISDNPEYLFFNESQYDHLNYNCIKIFYTGENIHPDFNICDYAFGFDHISFDDRYFRLPIYHVSTFYRKEELDITEGINQFDSARPFSSVDLAQKNSFCSFVYSNYLSDDTRRIFFEKLSKYKKVNSGGSFLNNVGGRVSNKLEFEMAHKFSIAFENSSNSGYTTEKLPNALTARTIPIYWGDPTIGQEFNIKRFINCHDYANFDDVIERVKEIDSDDDLYLQIINEPIFATGFNPTMAEGRFESWLKSIFDQPIISAKRIKINPAREIDLLENYIILRRLVLIKSKFISLFSLIYKPIKKVRFIEDLKKEYLAKKIKKQNATNLH